MQLALALLLCAADPAPSLRPTPAAPVPPAKLEEAINRGVQFLITHQKPDGSWGGPERTKALNILADVPGSHQAFHGAVTAMCVSALLEVDAPSTEAKKARERGEAWMIDNLPKLRRATPTELYNVWGHAYGIESFARLLARCPADDTVRRDKLRERIAEQVALLARYESVDGGWGYYDFDIGAQRPASSSTSFVNAAALVALHDAKLAGAKLPEKLVKNALASTQRQRKADNSYLYGEYLKWQPMRPINRPSGSLGRSQACNLALRQWGDTTVTDEVTKEWLDRLVSRNLWLDIGRKRPIPHESHAQVAGYFFFFGHYYAARNIDELPASERGFYRDHLAQLLLPLQEADGSWWDFPLYDYHQPYGTAFALMSLVRCRQK